VEIHIYGEVHADSIHIGPTITTGQPPVRDDRADQDDAAEQRDEKGGR
jgi:hypothetical protein